jgi:hypothetical protein
VKKLIGVLAVLLFIGGSLGLYYALNKMIEPESPVTKEEAVEPEPEEEEPAEPETDPGSPLENITPGRIEEVPPQKLRQFEATVKAAKNEAAIDRWTHAKSLLRQAIDSTSNTALRAIAGKEMGDVLLQEAKVKPWPNALAAQQYLEGARELEADPQRQQEIDELLTETRELLYTKELERIPESGSYFQMKQVLEQAKPIMTDEDQQYEYKLREANAKQQLLINPVWFKEYMLEHPDENPEDVRARLRDEAIDGYDWLVENTTGRIRDEALFRTAQLMVHEGLYDQADKTIQAFLNNEPTVFIPETMLLLAKIAQETGDSRKASSLLMQYIERYGITRESQQQAMDVVDEMVENGYYRDASDTLDKLSRHPQLIAQAGDMRARSLLLKAEYYQQIDEPENAEEILSKLVTQDFPPDIKQAAVSRLFEMQLAKNRGNIEMLLTGIQAVEADPDNEYAKNILVQMARTVEQMGLPQYAKEIYEKIALLGMAVSESVDSTNQIPLSIEAATLGTARCYFKEGNDVRADYLLRQICNNYEIGPLQSEAAFWWAQIAFKNDQLQEASRRLGLMDLSSLPPAFTAKARVLDHFINIKLGISNDEVIGPVLGELAQIPGSEHEFLSTYYSSFFELWDQRDDLDAMKKWYEGCRRSPHQELIPLNDFFYRIANRLMAEEGDRAVLSYIESGDDVLPPEQRDELLNELWADYIPELQRIKLTNRSIKLAINELYRKKHGR